MVDTVPPVRVGRAGWTIPRVQAQHSPRRRAALPGALHKDRGGWTIPDNPAVDHPFGRAGRLCAMPGLAAAGQADEAT